MTTPTPPTTPDPKTFPNALQLTADPAGPRYILDEPTRLALRMAYATGRPLLVVGEAGCGKSDLARALAQTWGVPLLPHVVHHRSEAADLLYHFDAVARLADAQVYAALSAAAASSSEPRPEQDPLNPAHYLRPGPLWWLIDRASALTLNQIRPAKRQFVLPEGMPAPAQAPATQGSANGAVVLIDEIDKGTEEVCEGLLEVLDQLSFSVPWTGQRVTLPRQQAAEHKKAANPALAPRLPERSMVIISSNASRSLPAPFLRRCLALEVSVPEDEPSLMAWLIARGQAHQGSTPIVGDPALQQAAKLIATHRQDTGASYKAGLAEYLNLLDAVAHLAPTDPDEQSRLIEAFAPSVTSHKARANARASA